VLHTARQGPRVWGRAPRASRLQRPPRRLSLQACRPRPSVSRSRPVARQVPHRKCRSHTVNVENCRLMCCLRDPSTAISPPVSPPCCQPRVWDRGASASCLVQDAGLFLRPALLPAPWRPRAGSPRLSVPPAARVPLARAGCDPRAPHGDLPPFGRLRLSVHIGLHGAKLPLLFGVSGRPQKMLPRLADQAYLRVTMFPMATCARVRNGSKESAPSRQVLSSGCTCAKPSVAAYLNVWSCNVAESFAISVDALVL
jgi:hypothetical protein